MEVIEEYLFKEESTGRYKECTCEVKCKDCKCKNEEWGIDEDVEPTEVTTEETEA